MLDHIKARFRKEKLSPEEQTDFIGELYYTNYRRYRVFTAVLFPIFLLLTIMDLVNREKGLWAVPGYGDLFSIHAATTVLLLLSILALFKRGPRSAGEVRALHRAILAFITAYVMVSLQLITFADVTIHGQITAYVTMALAIGAVTLLRPAEGLAFYAACLVMFVVGMDRSVEDYSQLEKHLVNGTVMTVIALVLSRIAYYSFRENHLRKKKIERQNEEIRRMDEKLRLTELEYHHLFDNSPIGVFRITSAGTTLVANRALLGILGFGSLDELNAKGILRLHVDQSDKAGMWEKARNGPVCGFETLFRRADGSAIPVSINCSLTLGEAGEPLFIEGTFEDISVRKRQEMLNEASAAALKQSEERYRLLADNCDDVIFTLDTGLRFTYISPSVMKLRGFSHEEALSHKLEETMTAESFARCMAEYARYLPDIEKGDNSILRIELQQFRKDRSLVWVEVNIRTMRDDAGRLTGYVGVSRDITERKNSEQALRDLEGRST